MADKKEEIKKVVLERVYNVPLRKGWLKAARYKRSKKAITTLREFLVKHMKSENIKIGKRLNELVWKHGIKNPPHHVTVVAKKYDDEIVKVELEGFEYVEAVKLKKKEEKPTGLKGKLQDALGKTEEENTEVKEKTPKAEEKKKDKTPAPKKAPVKKTPATQSNKVASVPKTKSLSKPAVKKTPTTKSTSKK
jgi:large subunit ribosomal protein L31e